MEKSKFFCKKKTMEKKANKYNVGISDYSTHSIQPYTIWAEYKLDPWRADIVKRVLRKKGKTPKEIKANSRLDLQKIIHICQYMLENDIL